MGILSGLRLGNKEPLRVAAYCRISFDEEDVDGSYENQRKFSRTKSGNIPAGCWLAFTATTPSPAGR